MTITTGSNSNGEAYVTMVTTDSYVVGALVLAHSLRKVGTTKRIICMVTSNLASDSITVLSEVFEIRHVQIFDSGDHNSLSLLGRPELGPSFTKLRLWAFTDLKKVVFLDADMLILQNIDDLFEREEFSACPDVGWPDCFNSGLFVCTPNLETYEALTNLASTNGSFDGGDQGILNAFFSDWATGPSHKRIPFVYNLTFNACYSYLPAFTKNKDNVKAVHFIGTTKPWNFNRFSDGQVAPKGDGSTVHLEYVQLWWDLHDQYIKPKAMEPNPPSFMMLYSGSGYNQHVGYPNDQSFTQDTLSSAFANYRIKWTDDVESFFQKSLKKAPSRKLVHEAEDSEDEHHYDSDEQPPIRKPCKNNLKP